jgi:5-methylcytosine-specific restriction protein A
MPDGMRRECRYSSTCPGYAEANGYCLAHQRAATLATRRPGQEQGLTPANKRFRQLRRAYLNLHPMCAACSYDEAAILDHRIPHRGNARLFWDQSNWQGLCVHCHGLKTARELWGRGPGLLRKPLAPNR